MQKSVGRLIPLAVMFTPFSFQTKVVIQHVTIQTTGQSRSCWPSRSSLHMGEHAMADQHEHREMNYHLSQSGCFCYEEDTIWCKSQIISLQENNRRQATLSVDEEASQPCLQPFNAKAVVNLQGISERSCGGECQQTPCRFILEETRITLHVYLCVCQP